MNSNALNQKVNTYLAMLFIAVVGAGAAMLIMHIANESDTLLAQSAGEVSAN